MNYSMGANPFGVCVGGVEEYNVGVIPLLIKSLTCHGCLQPLGHLQRYMTPIWIRLLMRMLFFWVLYHWLHFDKFFGLVNILNPEQGREGTSSFFSIFGLF